MYTKEFYHNCEDAREAAVNAAGQTGIIQDGNCTATGFDYISRDAINDDRDGDCKAFIVTGQDGNIIGVYAYAEEKPDSTMPYITDEHFYEREPADSFKYKLAEYMTKCCTKREGIYGYTYGISAEPILKMAEEELLKRGVVQNPAEWSEEEEKIIEGFYTLIRGIRRDGGLTLNKVPLDKCEAWLKSLRPQKKED